MKTCFFRVYKYWKRLEFDEEGGRNDRTGIKIGPATALQMQKIFRKGAFGGQARLPSSTNTKP
jgi:hypothetical protein